MTDAFSLPILKQRAVLRLSPRQPGEDVRHFLQGLVTQDTQLVREGVAVWTGLLSPQGKLLFDFLLWSDGAEDILIDCEAAQADALIKKLAMYRLRRAITIERDEALYVAWSPRATPAFPEQAPPIASSHDPRLAALGQRFLTTKRGPAVDDEWLAHRLSLGVAEGAGELGSDKYLWLECNAAELNGVSFTKGCYVGQENTARMNWRQKVNRRIVVVPLETSDEKRQIVAYPLLGLSVEHRRIENIDQSLAPTWLRGAMGNV